MAKSGIFSYARSFLDFRRWMGWDQLKQDYGSIRSIADGLFRVQRSTRVETFEQAIERLALDEEKLLQRRQYFQKTAKIYLAIAVMGLFYAMYLLFYRYFAGALLSFVFVLMMSSFSFREHFWYTQMTKRQLGMSFQQWFRFLVKGE